MKTILFISSIAIVSIMANFYFVKNTAMAAKELDACAEIQNVYSCKWVAVPTEAPHIVYKQAPILPPPVR